VKKKKKKKQKKRKTSHNNTCKQRLPERAEKGPEKQLLLVPLVLLTQLLGGKEDRSKL